MRDSNSQLVPFDMALWLQIERHLDLLLDLGGMSGKRDYRQSLERIAHGRGKQNGIDARLGHAGVLLSKGDAPGAAALAREALDIATALRNALPYSHRQGRASLMLGLALQRLQRGRQAQIAFEAAVLHLSNTVDGEHPLLLQARWMSSTP